MVYSGREDHLKFLLAGLQKTGVPLIEFDGTQYLPATMADDIGMYILIPKLAALFHWDIPTAIHHFFTGIAAISFCIGALGFLKLFSSWQARTISIVSSLVLTKIALGSMDIYCVPAMIALAVIPWAVVITQQHPRWGHYLFFGLAGSGCWLAHYLRSHSGTAPLLFIGILLLLQSNRSKAQKVMAFICLALGMGAIHLYFANCMQQYLGFVKEHFPHYTWVQPHHPLWHTIYAGLGFISNDLGLRFDDTAPMQAVTAKKPTLINSQVGPWNIPFSNQEYENILRNEVFTLLTKHTFYVIRVMVAKLGLILFYLLLFANLGLLFLSTLSQSQLIAFALTLMWSALPGLIAIPNFLYLTGYTTIAALLGLVALCKAIERDRSYVKNTITQRYQSLKSRISLMN
jgi:hypothetical protein